MPSNDHHSILSSDPPNPCVPWSPLQRKSTESANIRGSHHSGNPLDQWNPYRYSDDNLFYHSHTMLPNHYHELIFMAKGTFVTVINCMDGRVQEPVIAWMKEQFKADYVDMVTEAGPDGILANGPYRTVGAIIDRVRISVNVHGSRVVAVVAHTGCAGNPVTKKEHLEHLETAVQEVMSWAPEAHVLGLWVNRKWEVELIYDSREEDEE